MPFKFLNALSTFVRIMNRLNTIRKFLVVYFDNVLIYSIEYDTHLEHIH